MSTLNYLCPHSKGNDMKIIISTNDTINKDEVVTLYKEKEWSAASKPDSLLNALRHSHTLVTARLSGELIGLANAISDGYLVVYYPHMLVHPKHQRQGIGKKMMSILNEKYASFHQQMLTADINAVPFYTALGFVKAGNTESMWIYEGNDHSK